MCEAYRSGKIQAYEVLEPLDQIRYYGKTLEGKTYIVAGGRSWTASDRYEGPEAGLYCGMSAKDVEEWDAVLLDIAVDFSPVVRMIYTWEWTDERRHKYMELAAPATHDLLERLYQEVEARGYPIYFHRELSQLHSSLSFTMESLVFARERESAEILTEEWSILTTFGRAPALKLGKLGII